MRLRQLFIALILYPLSLILQPSSVILSQTPFASGTDTVFSVRWGMGQDFGRDRFPANVLGLPDTTARADRPSNNPAQVCSLGMGGEIVLGWKNAFLVNRQGADFTVFENAFLRFDNKVFAEPAKIAVSQDGVRFVEFPFDSLSLRGCAGITPTNGNQSPFNPRVSGGDSFDLATIGIDSVRFVRITDVSAIVLNNPRHLFYDPTITGFDLDAVVGLFLIPRTSQITSVQSPKPAEILAQMTVQTHNDRCLIELPTAADQAHGQLFSLQGALQLDFTMNRTALFSTTHLPRGAYLLVVRTNNGVWRKMIMIGG